jgi:hypothetical protein
MATLLDVTNQVLVRLREDPVTSDGLVNDVYANLVGTFVADITQEVNEACQWSALDHIVEFDLDPGRTTYNLALNVVDGGDVINGLRTTHEQSVLLYDLNQRPLAWMFDDSNDRYGHQMIQLDSGDVENRFQSDRQLTNERPLYFSVATNATLNGFEVTVNPIPSATRRVRMKWNSPDQELDPSTDGLVNILVPARIVRLGALYLALNERGEEIGEPGQIAELRYRNALGAGMEAEIRNRERTGAYDWQRR